MPVETLPVLEGLAAETAQESPGSRVRPDVLLQVGLDLEGLAAYLADVPLEGNVRVLLVHYATCKHISQTCCLRTMRT